MDGFNAMCNSKTMKYLKELVSRFKKRKITYILDWRYTENVGHCRGSCITRSLEFRKVIEAESLKSAESSAIEIVRSRVPEGVTVYFDVHRAGWAWILFK
jgi:hypothetical protein